MARLPAELEKTRSRGPGFVPLEDLPKPPTKLPVINCFKRGWAILKVAFPNLFAVGLVYVLIITGLSVLETVVAPVESDRGVEIPKCESRKFSILEIRAQVSPNCVLDWIVHIASVLIQWFLGLGMVRVGLEVVRGNRATVGMLFSEGGRFLPMLGLYILIFFFSLLYSIVAFLLMLGLHILTGGSYSINEVYISQSKFSISMEADLSPVFLCFIIPLIILMVRWSFAINALVDGKLGPVEALQYSWRLTRGNFWNIVGFWLLSVLVILTGLLALVVGIIVAIPVIFLAWMVAYRYLQRRVEQIDEAVINPAKEVMVV
ncbi:MAG: hypothetical protein RML49_08070 [Verrucomicrobiae bacterium]|nr:hypothetical protein [Verrucomicrobiae bacterium]